MPALTLLGRISAVSLLALAAAIGLNSQAASSVTSSGADNSSLASTTPADVPFPAAAPAPNAMPALPAQTDEQRGDYLIVHKEYQAAVGAYSRIAQPSAAVWNKMGIAYQMLYDSKNAARCYKQTLKLDPNHTGALNNLATIDDEQKDFPAAERLYRRALVVNPRSAQVLKNLGTNLLMQHKDRESSEAYAQALAIDPHILDKFNGPTAVARVPIKDQGEMSYLSALSCARAGQIDCALDYLRRAFNEGSATEQKVASESGFSALRQTPAYQRLVEEQH